MLANISAESFSSLYALAPSKISFKPTGVQPAKITKKAAAVSRYGQGQRLHNFNNGQQPGSFSFSQFYQPESTQKLQKFSWGGQIYPTKLIDPKFGILIDSFSDLEQDRNYLDSFQFFDKTYVNAFSDIVFLEGQQYQSNFFDYRMFKILFEDNVDSYKYMKNAQETWKCPNPNFKPQVQAITPPNNTHMSLKSLEQYVENMKIPKEVWEKYDDAKEEIVHQTLELQLSAYNWWKEQANPYISEQYQRIYENEMIKQLDKVKQIQANQQTIPAELLIIDKDKEIPDLSDYFKTFQEITKQNGFAMQCHTVKTSDGYLLDIFRIQPDNTKQFSKDYIGPKKPAVFMQHGFLASADCWVVNEHTVAPAFQLAREGYDVWIGNQRGSKYSRKHVHLDPDDKNDGQFWQFSFQEMGDIDAPAQIDYVREATGQDKITYVGHSQGTTQMFYGLATNEEYFKERINLFVALAPVVKMDKAPLINLLSFLAKFEWFLEAKLAEVGIYELFGKGWEVQFERITKTIPGMKNLRQYEDFTNSEFDSLEKSKVFEGHFPHGSSVRAVAHYSQLFNKQQFAKYDYKDPKKNMEKYGQETPPIIDVSAISSVPIAMFAATKDQIVHIDGNRWLKSQLVNNSLIKYQEIEFDHLSFLLAQDMSYFNDVIGIIKEMNPVNNLLNKYEQKMAKQYLEAEEKKKAEIEKRRQEKELEREAELVQELDDIAINPFVVMNFWGSAENENLYVLEYMREQQRIEDEKEQERLKIEEEMKLKEIEEQKKAEEERFEQIKTYGQLEKEMKKNLDQMYEQYMQQILNRTEYQKLKEFIVANNIQNEIKDMYYQGYHKLNVTKLEEPKNKTQSYREFFSKFLNPVNIIGQFNDFNAELLRSYDDIGIDISDGTMDVIWNEMEGTEQSEILEDHSEKFEQIEDSVRKQNWKFSFWQNK